VEAASFPPPLPAELYAAPQGRPQLGSLLLRDGAITLEQLEASLAEKEANGGRLGEILVRHGFASGSQVAQALADQHGLDYLDLGRFEVDPAATGLLPENIARRLGALPISFADDDVVLIAVSDPTDVIASDDLRLALGLQIRLAVVSADDLTRTRERCYGTNLSVEMEAFPEPPVAVEDIRDGMATNAPAIKLANQIISKAIEDGASDIHFEPQTHAMVVRARIDGVLRRVAEVPKGLQPAITSRLKIMGELDIADRRIPQDGRISIRYGGAPMDLRVAVLPTTYGEQVVLRILHRASGRLGLSDLGMSPEAEATFTRAVKQPYGAVLAVGPTGSGKTTTLYAALEYLNDESRALATIEDPVEYQIPGVNQVEVSARAGLTFARGLRTMLRSDPDVLLVGEVRDEETAPACATWASSRPCSRPRSTASSRSALPAVSASTAASPTRPPRASWPRRAPRGSCSSPRRSTGREVAPSASTGYTGRVTLYEVMPVVGKIRRLIEASTEEIFAAAVEAGMKTLREDGIRLCRAGVSSLEEIRRVTGDRIQ